METSHVGLRSSYRPGYVAVSPLTMQSSTCKQRGVKSDGGRQMLLSFPATRAILWDRRPMGDSVIVHPTHYRNPSLILEEKTLRLAHRFAQQSASPSYVCYLLATVTSDSDGQGLCITVDRFESSNKMGVGQSLDSVVIPCLVKKNSAKPKTCADDYGEALQAVCTRCYSKDKVDVQRFVAIKCYCSYHENQQTFLFHLDFTLVTSGVRFKMTPVAQVPIVPTALSKNLSGPRSMSELQGEPKAGYLTMDQTRKLLLVLESDPKVDSLPLVGLWVSGVAEITHPFVWACCLRYIFNPYLKERVVVPPEAFLVVLYSPVRSKPEYYECVTTDGSVQLKFNLSACHEVVQLPKDTLMGSGSPYEMEMVTVQSGDKMDAFEAALENNKSLMSPPKAKSSQPIYPDDITPRLGPMPQTRKKAPDIQPSVPEVSLLLDENEAHLGPRPVPQPMKMTHAAAYPEPNHSKTKKISKQRSTGQPPNNPVVNGYAHHNGSQPGTPQTYMPAQASQECGASQLNLTYPMQQYAGVPANFQASVSQAPVCHAYQPSPVSPAYPDPQFAAPRLGYPAYESRPPYVYPSGAASQPVYAPAMYNGAPAPNIAWPQPSVMPPHVHLPAQTQLSASNISPVPLYNHLQAGYPQNYPAPYQPTIQVTQSSGGPAVGMNTSQEQLEVPALPSQMKSPVLRPVRENSDMEDTVVKETVSTSARVSPARDASRQASHQSSPQHHTSGSTDSGLHFSDNPDPDVNNTVESMKSSATGGSVHPDVYELLRLQDAQLKQLREQLSQLLSRQGADQQSLASEATSQSSEATLQGNNSETKSCHDMATQMSNQATPVKQMMANVSKRTCSAAVNTSLFYPDSEQAQPNALNVIEQSGDLGFNLTDSDLCIQAGNITKLSVTSPVQSAAVARSRVDTLAMTQSPPRVAEDGGTSESGDTMSFENFQSLQIQDRTQESLVSEMMVDMPAYTSLSPDKRSGSGFTDTDESNRSPLLGESVSMYERNEAEADMSLTGVEEQTANTLLFKDQRQFYQNLMGNVQKLLGNTGLSDDIGIPETPQPPQRSGSSPDPGHGRADSGHPSGTPSGLNRSLSLPANVGDGDHQNTALNPLRQSYPFHDDVRNSGPMNDDVAEKTRRQLEAMGIHLEKLNPVEKSRMLEQSSFFLDPSLLPKMQYVSMVLDSENDVSAEADALAMKYLSDEQLTELAKLRSGSPGKFRRGREFDRILSPSTPLSKSNNSTLYGANHMSFASRKYLERYGLLENASGGELSETGTAPKSVATESDRMATPGSMRVKDFLQSLQERSFSENDAPCAVNRGTAAANEQALRQTSSGHQYVQSETSLQSTSDTSGHFKVQTKLLSTPKPQPQKLDMERTPHIPTRVPESVQNRHVFNNSAPHIPTEVHVQVFDKTPRASELNPEAVALCVNNHQKQFLDGKVDEEKSSQVENVLDIQRLKELPKLL